MSITITTPATVTNLCLLEDLPDNLRGADFANDPLLLPLIVRASALIARYCKRHFAAQVYTEIVPSFGGTILQLGRSLTTHGLYPGGPLTTLTSVTDVRDSSVITGSVVMDTMALQLYHSNGWSSSARAESLLQPNIIPGGEREVYSVVYTAGYVLPAVGQAVSVTTLPEDLRAACLEGVTRLWNRRERDPDVARINIPGDVDITYRTGSAGQSATIEQLLGLEVLTYLDQSWRVWEFA